MARTRGKDSLERPAKGAGRRRRVVHIFTEGLVTEPSYIDILKEQGVPADPTMKVEMHVANRKAPGSHRKPLNLVEEAVRLMQEESRKAKRAKLGKDFLPQVWCLFDRDEHEGIETALKQAKDGNVRVAFSHPCFEVWRLAHHKPVTGTFAGVCGQATQRLPFARTPQDAANIKLVLPHQISGRFPVAKKNAERMNAQHGDHVSLLHRDPYTDMHVFVEEGLGLGAY
ncbi:RloB family protein [Streptomyces sp. NPDC056637]|uniref:RloB family protein n=1 Tax=unclassified Streptomyces TaxID=2593676 RepID=UPI0036BDF113